MSWLSYYLKKNPYASLHTSAPLRETTGVFLSYASFAVSVPGR